MAKERVLTGLTVVMEHLPGVYSLYYHMDSIRVEQGQMVEAGMVIGTVGSTGLVTGPHLHWEIRAGGIAVNPDTFIEKPIIDKEAIMSIITP